jgi:hypothetical protein
VLRARRICSRDEDLKKEMEMLFVEKGFKEKEVSKRKEKREAQSQEKKLWNTIEQEQVNRC